MPLTSVKSMLPGVHSPLTRAMQVTVRKKAMGSLLPLSNSRRGLRSFLKSRLRVLKMPKTLAASVEETMEPKRKAEGQEKYCGKMSFVIVPKSAAVRSTPTVERIRPLEIMGRIL